MTFNLILMVFFSLVGMQLAKIHSGMKSIMKNKGESTTERPRMSCFICPWVSDDHGCGDGNFSLEPNEPSYYMDDCKVCYKKTQYNASDAKLAVLRGCSIENWVYLPGCQYTYYEGGFYIEVCACTSDYCNGGIFQLSSSPTAHNRGFYSVHLVLLISLLGCHQIVR